MAKIGIDIRLIGKNRTGDEVVFFNLTKNLAKIDNNNEYYLFTDATERKELKEISERLEITDKKNFRIIPIKTKNRFSWNFWDLPRYLRQSPLDVYLTQYITPFFVPKSIKIVTIIHDISFNFFPRFIKKSDLLFLKTLIPLGIRRADRVLGVSKFTRDEIVRYYDVAQDKVGFFYNAVSEDFKSQDVSEKKLALVKEKYNLPKKFILYLGTLQPRKNIPFLIESYAKIKEKLPEIKLVLVGNAKARNFDRRINEVIGKYNLEEDVVLPGFIDEKDKAAIYKLAHVFVFPSLYEGFGIPVLEAFETKTPVLAADIPSLREVGGKGALFADPRGIDKFSEALYIICIEENLRNELIGLGNKITELFLWEKTARELLVVFENIFRK